MFSAKTSLLVALLLGLLSNISLGEVRDDYELTVDVAVRAVAGWKLYLQKEFAGQHREGHYTNPEPDSPGHEFWSDGLKAEFDRDHNGHFETVFDVKDEKLVYRGSRGSDGTFVHTSRALQKDQQSQRKPKEPSDDESKPGGYADKPKKRNPDQTDKQAIELANKGWGLYQKKEFANDWKGGHYTDPVPDERGYEFWSDEVIAKFDRQSDGHHESIFFVNNKSKLEYVGRISGKGKFAEVERRFRKFKNKPLAEFQRMAENIKRRNSR